MSTYLKRISVICFIFTVLIGQIFMPIIGHAQELNTTGFVDSFAFEKTKLNYGEKTTIHVNFSEKPGKKMKSGDTLTLALPPELKGYSGTIALKDDSGRIFGTCQINANNVVCTFNDTVEKLENIRGNFNFTVQGTNVEAGKTKDVQTNLGTDLEKQMVSITHPKGEGTEPGMFFYKSGDIQPDKSNEVRWFLNINLKKQYLHDNIVLKDTLQEGQMLNKGSFYITINNKEYLSLEQFQQRGYGYIKFTSDNSFEVVVYRHMGNATSFTIAYTSTITESGKKLEFLQNDYKLDYQILYEKPTSESNSVKVENISFGGGAEGVLPAKGTLQIVKHIKGDENKFIPGVSFKLFTESGQQIGDSYTTNQDGIVEAPNLAPGNYYVQEISAPNYVEFDPQAKIPFTIKTDATNGIKLMVPNKLKTTFVAGTKTWEGDKVNDRPKTIKVDLLQNGKVIATKEVTAENGWKYEFGKLPAVDSEGKAHTYEVKEQPVSGYQSKVNGYDIINIKIHEVTEVEEQGEEESIEELEAPTNPETPQVTEEPKELEKPEVTEKPEIHVTPEEEKVEEGTTEEIKEEKPETPNVTEEPKELEKPEVTEKPEIHVTPEEEQVEEETTEETTEEIKEEKPEEPKVTEEPKELEKPEVTEKPEIHVTPEEEQVEEETTEEIKEEKPEEPKVTEEPKELEKPEVTEKPEIHVKPEEEQVEEETIEEIKEEKPEEPKVTEEPKELEKPEVTEKPEIHVTPEEEQVEEETIEEIKEEKPEEPKVTGEPKELEKSEVTEKPEVHVKPKEEKVEEETTEEIKEEKPEEPKVTEEPKELEKPEVTEEPEVTEKPEIHVTPEEEQTKEETKEVLNKQSVQEKVEVQNKPNVQKQVEVQNKPNVQEQVEVQNKQEVHSKVEVQNKSEVSSSGENNKKSKLLPQTGGASTEATSVMAGMFLLLFGAMLFRRQKN
ncbi:Cna B-type domain-containing protein [Bacillus albus]|nr:Cna B-type domain-containing protein [Bacillus albus]RXJ21470.1 Cna B-type domain-containing protein [Bacillus albus]RXJ27481.1 Cna B-type domain-containing protein [Bacillus albus]RXJ31677.1 Cna B-type domain-containing protein [Bacillus albus]RXJ42902.1 Cna B-type domain-containing protein [Bacillus albus]RXJ59873.1 Cna B-type domain-containing protein [Bacillus albus]